jgi:hypothetical protein
MRERKRKASLWVFPNDYKLLHQLIARLQQRHPELVVTVADAFHEAVLALEAKLEPKP